MHIHIVPFPALASRAVSTSVSLGELAKVLEHEGKTVYRLDCTGRKTQ